MADWSYIPSQRGHGMGFEPAITTLVDRFGDGKEISRERSATILRTWDEPYILNATDSDAAVNFFKTKRTHLAFTRVTYDPDESPGATAYAKFVAFRKAAALPGGYSEFQVRMREVVP